MIFKQIHSLPIGPNWVKIVLITGGVILVLFVVHNAVKRDKLKIEPKPQPGDANK